jgi:hypothetical protein
MRKTHSLLAGMQNRRGTLEDSLVASYKAYHAILPCCPTTLSSKSTPLYLLKITEHVWSHEHLHMDVHKIFIHKY